MEEILENLRLKGYRVTEVREKVIDIFWKNKDNHLTIDDIIEKLKKEKFKINVASLYNTLKILVDEQVIDQYNFQDKKIFELNQSIHGHFICKKCKKTINISVPGLDCLDMLINKKYKTNIENHKIEFYGLCEDCKKKGR